MTLKYYMRREHMKIAGKNPITELDYPDPDVIRVDDTYYMVSTTMHFLCRGVRFCGRMTSFTGNI